MNTSDGMLRAFVSRIEKLEEEKAALATDIKEVYQEAKSNGFCVKTLRRIIAIRKKEDHARAEEEAMLATYMAALGMIPQLSDTPLGQASLPSASQRVQEAAKTEAEAQATRDLDNARRKGLQAGRSDIPETENPYLFDDPRHGAWSDGWKVATSKKELVAA